MLFEIVKSIVIILEKKQLFYPKVVLDFMQKHYSVTAFVHISLQ